jgi:hypothetical protein
MKNNNDKNKQTCVLHGEAMLFPAELPSNAVEIKPTNNDLHIIADSETTGNHHVVDIVAGTKVYRSGDRTFIRNSKPTQVRCVHANRHDAITMPPAVWEVGIQQEYDHFAQNMRAVRD